MKNKRTGKQVLISVVIVVAFVALASMTGTRRVLSAATFTVTNTSDCVGAGCGSLRQAIVDANTTAGADTINFAAGVTGAVTLASALPQITESVTISGPGAGVLTVSGASAFQVLKIAGGVTASISGLTISNGTSNAGGGIANSGNLTVTNSTFSGNFAVIEGGGLFNGGTLTVTNSTFSGNSASAGGVVSAIGGGIANSGTLTATNSTFSGNSATDLGGGIVNGPLGTLKVTNSTFSGNSASRGGGINNAGMATFKNSIIANSTAGGNCAGNPITAVGVNFSTDNTCAGFTQVTAIQLNLGPLANNGGPTKTHALLAGSVAIDAVTDCTDLSLMPAPVTTDQRGKPRPADGDGNGSALCDAGAFELQPCSMVTCPANITQSNDPNQCGAVVNYPAPTAGGDSCGTVTCTPASGSFFPVGMTTVNCDASGTTANPDCSFTVTVNDTQPPTITCPANITVATDPNQCSAVVSYKLPTPTDNCSAVTTCLPPSGFTFQKGTTTVTCTATDSSNNTGSCTFTVTVNDTQPPTITCPTNVTAVAAQTCPISSSATVTFPAPTVSDNCPGVTSVCTPPSGSIFPVGTTTVTCTATDTSGNTATCTFTVTVFSGCLQDDSNPANVVLFNAATGEYRFCCGGTVFTGVGTALVKGCVVTIQHYPADRRVLIKFDGAVGAGTASLQSPPGSIRCTITDRNTRNNSCACQ